MRIRSLLSPAHYRRTLASARARQLNGQDPPEPARQPGVRGAALSAAITAIVTIVITAALTPLGSALGGAVQSVLGVEGAAPGVPAADEPSAEPAPGSLERVADPSGVLSLQVPAGWGAVRAKNDTAYGQDAAELGRRDYLGTAMIAGDSAGISDPYGWNGSYVYFSASRDAATHLDLVGASADRLSGWTEQFLQADDWTIDGCVLAGSAHPVVDGYVTAMRRWEKCAGLSDARLWELAAASEDGSVIAVVQLTASDISDETASRIVSSFLVASEKLPAPSTGPGDLIVP